MMRLARLGAILISAAVANLTTSGCATDSTDLTTQDVMILASGAGVEVPDAAKELNAESSRGGWKNDGSSVTLTFSLTATETTDFLAKTVPGAKAVDVPPRVSPCIDVGQTFPGSRGVNGDGTPRDISGPVVDYFVTTGMFEGCSGFETRTKATGRCRVTVVTKAEDDVTKLGIAITGPPVTSAEKTWCTQRT